MHGKGRPKYKPGKLRPSVRPAPHSSSNPPVFSISPIKESKKRGPFAAQPSREKRFLVKPIVSEAWKQHAIQTLRSRAAPVTPSHELSRALPPKEKAVAQRLLVRLMDEFLPNQPKIIEMVAKMSEDLMKRSNSSRDFFQEPARVDALMKELNRSYDPTKTNLFSRLLFVRNHWKRALYIGVITLAYARIFREADISAEPEHVARFLIQKKIPLETEKDVESLLHGPTVIRLGEEWVSSQAARAEKRMRTPEDVEKKAREHALQTMRESFSDLMLPSRTRAQFEEDSLDLAQRGQYHSAPEIRKKALRESFAETVNALQEIGFRNAATIAKDLGIDTSTPKGIDQLKMVQRVLKPSATAAIKKRVLLKLLKTRQRPLENRLEIQLKKMDEQRKLSQADLDAIKRILSAPQADALPLRLVNRAIRYWILIEIATRTKGEPIEVEKVIRWVAVPERRKLVEDAIVELKKQFMLIEENNKIRFTRQAERNSQRYDLRTRLRR